MADCMHCQQPITFLQSWGKNGDGEYWHLACPDFQQTYQSEKERWSEVTERLS